jgi:hypothetical protein
MVRSAGGPVRGREWAAATDRVLAVESETPAGSGIRCFDKPRIRDGKKSGSGMEKNPDPGWKKIVSDHFRVNSVLRIRIRAFLNPWTRDPGRKYPDPGPQH